MAKIFNSRAAYLIVQVPHVLHCYIRNIVQKILSRIQNKLLWGGRRIVDVLAPLVIPRPHLPLKTGACRIIQQLARHQEPAHVPPTLVPKTASRGHVAPPVSFGMQALTQPDITHPGLNKYHVLRQAHEITSVSGYRVQDLVSRVTSVPGACGRLEGLPRTKLPERAPGRWAGEAPPQWPHPKPPSSGGMQGNNSSLTA